MGLFSSSTKTIPTATVVPKHIAVIMDGNGRWAKKRFLPRIAGHKIGVDRVRDLVKTSAKLGVEYLTLFAFSSENWRRPADEVSFLMGLFAEALTRESKKLHENNIRLKIIGDTTKFEPNLQKMIAEAETLTADNSGLVLTIATNYGGRWDILQAANKVAATQAEITEESLNKYLSMYYAPEPDLFIRTGGEERISNFLLWQLAYTELYFTQILWPEFDDAAFGLALHSYQQRERRFGRTSDQLTPLGSKNPVSS